MTAKWVELRAVIYSEEIVVVVAVVVVGFSRFKRSKFLRNGGKNCNFNVYVLQ